MSASEIRAATVDLTVSRGVRSPAEASRSALLTTAIVWGSAALAPLLSSIAGLSLARGLAAADYGEVAYFLSVVGLVVLLGSLGLTTQITTVIARFSAGGSFDGEVPQVLSLVVVRLATIAVIGTAALVAGEVGHPVVRVAGLTGGVVLATGFVHGAIRGSGRARLAAVLQVVQSSLYLAAVMTWVRDDPDRAFIALAASYGFCLMVGLPFLRVLRDAGFRIGTGLRISIRSIARSSSQVYLLSLLLAPFASVAVVTFGAAGRFSDAALFSAALTLALAPSTALSLVVSIQYYPRACTLGTSGDRGAAWYDHFYRRFASLAVAAVALQVVFAGDVIAALFGDKYLGAADPLRSLAGAGAFLNLGQLAVWTLFAHGRVRAALTGTGAQLAGLLASVALMIHFPELPLWALGAGHTVAAATGLVIYASGIKGFDRGYRFYGKRVAGALLLALVVEVSLRALLLGVFPGQHLPLVALVVATVIAALVSAVVLVGEIPPTTLRPATLYRRIREW